MRIRGISLRLHPTWFLVLALLTSVFARDYRDSLGPEVGAVLVWVIALASALLLFLSVVLHEFGHSFVALSQGVKVRSITLFFLGGVANTESECRTARGEFLMAAAGPAVSLLLGAGLLLARHGAFHLSPALGEMSQRLGELNLVLAFFNLLPGLPLDGGRILKALVWQVTGSQQRGVLLQRLLTEMRVQDVAKRRFRVLEADESLRAVSRIRFAQAPPSSTAIVAAAQEGGPADWLLVCHRGRWLGVIDDQPLQELPVQRWDEDRVRDHMRPLSTLPSIPENAPLWQAVLGLEESEQGRLLVLSPAGLPCGTLERPDVGEAVLARLGVRLPEPLLAKARQQNTYPLGLALASVARAVAETAKAGPVKPGTS